MAGSWRKPSNRRLIAHRIILGLWTGCCQAPTGRSACILQLILNMPRSELRGIEFESISLKHMSPLTQHHLSGTDAAAGAISRAKGLDQGMA